MLFPGSLVITLLMVVLTTLAASAASGEFVMESAYHASVKGDGNTLRSMATGLNNPEVLRLAENHILLCTVSPYIYGQLLLGPQEKLVLSDTNWGRRFVFLYGQAQWENCTIEGAVWVDAGNDSTGLWKNATFEPNDTHGYPVVWFRSKQLRWEGGLVDALPKVGPPAAICLGTRGGYISGSFTNTIHDVTFRSAQNLLEDNFSGQRQDVDLTLDHCVIETTGAHSANIVTRVNATDGCTSVITLKDCVRRHNGVDGPASTMVQRGEVKVLGSACKVRFVEQGKVVAEIERQDNVEARMEPGNLLKTLRDGIAQLGPRLAKLSAEVPLHGTLCYARARFDDLQAMLKGLEVTGRYCADDRNTVQAALAQVRDTLRYAPQTLKPGLPFNPPPAALDVPPSGEARIERRNDDRLAIHTWQSEWIYSRNADGKHYATFLPESQVRGRPIFGGAFPNLGGPSVRYVYPGDSGTMMWEFPWQPRITQEHGKIVAFETALMTSKDYGTRATWIFFHDLPDVILCNSFGIQPHPPGQPLQQPILKMQAYARPDLKHYNGMRLWNKDPKVGKSSNIQERASLTSADAYEPQYGFFSSESPWFVVSVSKGFLLAQYNGRNDWQRNPPCGYILRADEMLNPWVASGGYFTLGGLIKPQTPPRDDNDLNIQALWFEGAGLKCWDNVYNLEAAFSHPCQPLLDLTNTERPVFKLWERAGLARNVEIVTLPAPYAALQSDREWYRGDICVTLLRDVRANGEVALGTLPVQCSAQGDEYHLTNQAALLRDLWVRIRATTPLKTLTVNGKQAENLVTGDGWIAVRCDLLPGDNVMRP